MHLFSLTCSISSALAHTQLCAFFTRLSVNESAEYAEARQNIRSAQLLLYKATEPIFCSEDSTSFPKELEPISIEEKSTVVNQYWNHMDPESNIYGCACCGVWVILPKNKLAFSRTLFQLQCLRLNKTDDHKYLDLADEWKRLRGVTICEDTYRYFLYRIYLTIPCTDATILDPVPETSVALLCNSCYKNTTKRIKRPPPMSLKAGVDYGLAWMYLPELSFIEKLLLQKYQIFAHLFKATTDSSSGLSIKGAVIALKTNAREILEVTAEEERNKVTALPNRSIKLQIQFLGNLQKWNVIKTSKSAGRSDFIKLFGKIFDVNSSKLLLWLNFLINVHVNIDRTPRYSLDAVALQQENLDNIVDDLFKNASAHYSNSMSAHINVVGRESVVGRDQEGVDVGNGVEHYFVNDTENVRVGQQEEDRRDLFTQFYEQLPLTENEAPLKTIKYDKKNIANEYTEIKVLMEGAFPWLFPFGYGYKNDPLTVTRSQHMLHQCSNVFSNEAIWVALVFDMFKRRTVSIGVAVMNRTDPETVKTVTELVNDPTFKEQLLVLIQNPKSPEAKLMESFLSTLVHKCSKNVPFSTVKSSIAFSQMLALNRFFGDGAFFLTIAPTSWKQKFFYRLVVAHKSNAGSMIDAERVIKVPDTNRDRKALKFSSPYADVVTFIRHSESFIQHLLQTEQVDSMTRESSVTIKAWKDRLRGLLGHVTAVFTATETSANGALHTHSIVYTPFSLKVMELLVGNPVYNKLLGEGFMNSLVSGCLNTLHCQSLAIQQKCGTVLMFLILHDYQLHKQHYLYRIQYSLIVRNLSGYKHV